MKLPLILLTIVFVSCNESDNKIKIAAHTRNEKLQLATPARMEANNFDSLQIAIVQQQAWENLNKVPGTERDYTTTIRLRIANGNIMDGDCKLVFRKDSWAIASIIVNDYKGVLKNTSSKIFSVIYKLITDPEILANEIDVTGLWRPWLGSHVHIEGRGIDIGSIRSSLGSGAIFNLSTSHVENQFAKAVRQRLTTNFPIINQYLSPWFICNPPPSCGPNNGQTPLEKTHRDHLHLTLNQ
jgi:hypothetical protein